MLRPVFKMERRRFKDIGTKVFPCLCFSEDGMAQSTRAIATFLSVAKFEDQLHFHGIPEAEMGSCSPRYSQLLTSRLATLALRSEPYAGAAIPILAYHGVAPVIASFTALIFFTPSFCSHSSSALMPYFA